MTDTTEPNVGYEGTEEPTPSDAAETEACCDGFEMIHERLDELERLVRERPLAAIGVAAGAGLVIGLLFSPRR